MFEASGFYGSKMPEPRGLLKNDHRARNLRLLFSKIALIPLVKDTGFYTENEPRNATKKPTRFNFSSTLSHKYSEC